jgi:hypothetical protein
VAFSALNQLYQRKMKYISKRQKSTKKLIGVANQHYVTFSFLHLP